MVRVKFPEVVPQYTYGWQHKYIQRNPAEIPTPNSNTVAPDWPQHDHPTAACVTGQQYSHTTFVIFYFHPHPPHKYSAHVLLQFFFTSFKTASLKLHDLKLC